MNQLRTMLDQIAAQIDAARQLVGELEVIHPAHLAGLNAIHLALISAGYLLSRAIARAERL